MCCAAKITVLLKIAPIDANKIELIKKKDAPFIFYLTLGIKIIDFNTKNVIPFCLILKSGTNDYMITDEDGILHEKNFSLSSFMFSLFVPPQYKSPTNTTKRRLWSFCSGCSDYQKQYARTPRASSK